MYTPSKCTLFDSVLAAHARIRFCSWTHIKTVSKNYQLQTYASQLAASEHSSLLTEGRFRWPVRCSAASVSQSRTLVPPKDRTWRFVGVVSVATKSIGVLSEIKKKKKKITSRSLGTVIMCCFLLSERGMKEHVNDWLLSPWPPIALGASSWQQSRVPGCHERLWLWWYCTLTSLNRIKQPHNLEDLGGTSRSNTIQFLHSKGSDAVESRRYQKPHGVATSYPQPV